MTFRQRPPPAQYIDTGQLDGSTAQATVGALITAHPSRR